MLPRSFRVSTSLFDQVYAKSRVISGPHFSLRTGLYEGINPRFAVVASKKVDNRAVKRNSLRRKGYRALQDLVKQVKPGSVTLFFAKKGSENLSQEEFHLEFKELLNRAGLLKKDNLIQ